VQRCQGKPLYHHRQGVREAAAVPARKALPAWLSRGRRPAQRGHHLALLVQLEAAGVDEMPQLEHVGAAGSDPPRVDVADAVGLERGDRRSLVQRTTERLEHAPGGTVDIQRRGLRGRAEGMRLRAHAASGLASTGWSTAGGGGVPSCA
jgi:hypothetical protein